MWWLSWRQHRGELAVAVLLLAVVAVPLVINGVAMREAYESDGVAACVTDPSSRDACTQIIDKFLSDHLLWSQRLVWIAALPALAGVLVGAPLLAREFEQGTWKLAFTQSVTRTRWLGVKLAFLGSGVVAVAVAFAALCMWWRAPLDAIEGRMHATAFMVSWPTLGAVALFAFAAGALAGAVLRRTIAAMVATLVVFVTVRVPAEDYLRPHYRKPRVRITDPVTGTGEGDGDGPRTDWIVDNGWVDSSGRRLSQTEEWTIVQKVYGGTDAIYGAGTPVERYMAEHGLRHYTEYHSNSSFWTFQAIESALFLGVAAVMLGATVWVVRRRTT